MFLLIQATSVFADHLMQVRHKYAVVRETSYNLPIFILLFICCALLMYVYLRYYKKSEQQILAVFSYSAAQQIQREGYSLFKSFSIAWFLIYTISTAIFLADLTTIMGWLDILSFYQKIAFYIILLGFLLLFKKAEGDIIGNITKNPRALDDYFSQYALNISTAGLFLLVICLLEHYSSIPAYYLMVAGMVLLALLFIFRLLKVLFFGRVLYGFSLFHLLLYLCATEIIPLAVFIKVVVKS